MFIELTTRDCPWKGKPQSTEGIPKDHVGLADFLGGYGTFPAHISQWVKAALESIEVA